VSEQAEKTAAPAPAPPARVADVVALPAAPLIGGFMGPAEVISLQRTAGNRAVTGLLQRTKKGAGGNPEPIAGGDVTVGGSMGVPQITGSTRAALTNVGPDSTRIFGPTMKVSAEVTLATGVELTSDLTVGYIQNMTSGDRVAVYTTDGTPAGTVVAETHLSVAPNTRDAAAHFKQDQNKNLVSDPNGNPVVEADIGPPWFSSPQVFQAGGPKTYTIEATDTPSFPVPLNTTSPSGKAGKLASIRGKDSFAIALAVKDGANAPINLAASTWAADWTMTIDPSLHTGTGAAGKPAQAIPADQVKPGTGLSHDDKQAWSAPVSDAEADAMSLGDLMRSLPSAKQYDSVAYFRIVEAMRRRNNPQCFHATVFVEEDDSIWGDDDIEVSMEGVRGRKAKVQKGGTGKPVYYDWQLYDLFDPQDITAASSIKVQIARVGQPVQERSWVFRWGDTDNRTHKFSGSSKYQLKMSFH
jgi:hypothetical protein